MKRWLFWALILTALVGVWGCGDEQQSADATGGSGPSAGKSGTGGSVSTGGSVATGGTVATGGSTSTGGASGGAGMGGGCSVGQSQCSDGCKSVMSDNVNCGMCGHVCATGQSCSAGTCACNAPLATCGSTCANLQGDGNNCGACGVVCGPAEVCSAGVCGTTCGGQGQVACGTSCVDLTSDVANCGNCGKTCGAGQLCQGSTCQCVPGLLSCGVGCVNPESDTLNCGMCGLACGVGQTCQQRLCTGGGTGGAGGAGGIGGAGANSGGAGNGGALGGAGAGVGGTGGRGGAGAGGLSGNAGRGGAGMGGGGRGGAGAGGAGAGGRGGAGGTGGTGGWYPCDGTTTGYNALMTKSGSTWTVTNGGSQRYSGTDTQAALTAAFNSLTSGRTTKQSVLMQGDGDIPATAQFGVPSYTILNICGTINVSGTPSGSDRSPLYVRGRTQVDIPHAKMTGSPQYGIFIRESDNVHLGQIDLRLTSSAGIGIRVDSGGNASTETTFNTNFTLDYVYGTGMGSHVVETYGIDGVHIGTVEGNAVGECGLLLNRSINAEVDLVTCTNCATGTGYAAFRVANDVGKVGTAFPAGNIHVKKVVARGGGRGIFSVSGCGGLTIDQIDIANVGSTSILLQNTYNTTIAAQSGTVVAGLVQISNDTTNTESGRYPPSKDVHIQNLTLSGGASVRQDWCTQYGKNGCTATNVTGGTVSMCP